MHILDDAARRQRMRLKYLLAAYQSVSDNARRLAGLYFALIFRETATPAAIASQRRFNWRDATACLQYVCSA